MRRTAPHMCVACKMYLPRQVRQYAELCGGWAVEHGSGGAHSIHAPNWTGRVMCELCFDKQRPRPVKAKLRELCDDCDNASVRYRQLAHAWTRLPKANEVLDAHYAALALCEPCFVARLQGVQGTLFDA